MAEIVQPPPAASTPGPPPSSLFRSTLRKVWSFLIISPISALLIYTGLSLAMEENYPFSHYPMYSNPSSERPYYTITDGESKPLPIQKMTGVTCPKIGKIFRKKCDDEGKATKQNAKKLSPASLQKVCDDIFAQLRHEAREKKEPLPARLQLMRTTISFENGKVVEESELIGAETLSDAAPVPAPATVSTPAPAQS